MDSGNEAKGPASMSDVDEMTGRTGWVKPERAPTIPELRELITRKRGELAELEAELQDLVDGPRLEALVQIRNIMRAQGLTLGDLELAAPPPKAPLRVRAPGANVPVDAAVR